MLINFFQMESGREGGMDANNTAKTCAEKDSNQVLSSTTELNSQFVTKHGLNFEKFCKERANAINVSPVSHVSNASTSYLVSKPIPGTKHTIDAILGLRNSQTLNKKCHSNDVKSESNCNERSCSESIGSNSKSGK